MVSKDYIYFLHYVSVYIIHELNYIFNETAHAVNQFKKLELYNKHALMKVCPPFLNKHVQVLFSEQVKMRTTMQPAPNGNDSEQEGNQSATDMEIKILKAELENVKLKIAELHSDYSELQQEYDRIGNKHKNTPRWSISWRKIKKSFHTKVDGDDDMEEEPEGQQRLNSVSKRNSFRRRLSIA